MKLICTYNIPTAPAPTAQLYYHENSPGDLPCFTVAVRNIAHAPPEATELAVCNSSSARAPVAFLAMPEKDFQLTANLHSIAGLKKASDIHINAVPDSSQPGYGLRRQVADLLGCDTQARNLLRTFAQQAQRFVSERAAK